VKVKAPAGPPWGVAAAGTVADGGVKVSRRPQAPKIAENGGAVPLSRRAGPML